MNLNLVRVIVCVAAVAGCGQHQQQTTETMPTFTPMTVTTTQPVRPAVTVTTPPRRGTAVQVETTTTIPQPREWLGPLPSFYGGDTGCSRDEASTIARTMWKVGASDSSIEWMLSMISRESLCDPAAHNGNRRTGDDSWGLCQQNVLAGHFDSDGILAGFDRYQFATDFEYNAAACAHMWSICGRGPWTRGDYGCRQPAELA